MALPKAFLRAIIYIYPSKKAAESGEKSGGTGFLVSVITKEKGYLYVVTNAHVIDGIQSTGNNKCAIRFNTLDDKIDAISARLSDWIKHPNGDDIAVYPIEPSSRWLFSSISESTFINRDFIHTHYAADETEVFEQFIEKTNEHEKWNLIPKIGIGDPVVTIGRYSLHSGKERNLPVARFGHVSMLPFEPVHQTDRDFDQESFLVETFSISAFSGSPVFVDVNYRERTDRADGGNMFAHKGQACLLGIDWGHFDFKGELIGMASQGIKVPSGMACVVPAWKLSELLHTTELEKQRKKLDNIARKARLAAKTN